MTLDWRKIAKKLGGWLLKKGVEEAEKEIERKVR